MNITRVRGKRSKTPWQRIEAKWPNIAAPGERVVLRIEVGHPGAGHRPGDADALEVRVHGDGKAELVARPPDRVVHGVAVRDPRGAGQEDAGDLIALAEPPDLRRGGLGMLRRDDEQPAQARLALEPLGEQPVVVAAAQRRRRAAGWAASAKAAASSGVRIPKVTSNGSSTLSRTRSSVWPTSWAPSARRLAVVGVRPQPAGGVVPGVGRHAQPVGPRLEDELARRAVEIGQQIAQRVVADVDVAIDEHAHTLRSASLTI